MTFGQPRRLVAICTLAAGLALGAGVFAQTTAPDQAAWLVEHTEVSYAEAQRHLAHDAQISRLQVQMSEEAADTFGGLWIEWVPKYRIVVLFTGDAKAQLRTFTSDPDFVARTTPRSEAFMDGLLDEVVAKVAPLGLLSEGWVDIPTSQILILTTDVRGTKGRLASLMKVYPFIHVDYGLPPTPN